MNRFACLRQNYFKGRVWQVGEVCEATAEELQAKHKEPGHALNRHFCPESEYGSPAVWDALQRDDARLEVLRQLAAKSAEKRLAAGLSVKPGKSKWFPDRAITAAYHGECTPEQARDMARAVEKEAANG